jgi:DNA (cytosine-5)-methyltransferase 1
MSIGKPRAIDLFCGCGGLSAGLRDAGFDIIAGVDIEPKYMATFQHNFREAHPFNLDLTKYSPKEIMTVLGIKPGELDLLAGGPPCQGFSKNVPRKFRYMDDANNLLVRTFLDYCEAIAPKLILMENVAEMKNGFARQFSDEVTSRLYCAGYSVTPAILNAAEYGIPQRRRRAFFLAARRTSSLSIPPSTHYKETGQIGLLSQHPFVNVWEAIGDLPSVNHGEGEVEFEYACEAFSDYQQQMRNSSGKVRNHVARHLEPTQYARLAALLPGQGHKDLPDHLKVRGGYSGAYGRLTKGMVAPTMTRWLFHPGSGRWGHPVDIRTLTIREAARIQGFTDGYEFIGSFVQQAGQIGNAAPPLLIKQISLSMRAQLSI